jgi:hypothetical protein
VPLLSVLRVFFEVLSSLSPCMRQVGLHFIFLAHPAHPSSSAPQVKKFFIRRACPSFSVRQVTMNASLFAACVLCFLCGTSPTFHIPSLCAETFAFIFMASSSHRLFSLSY